jgi:D-alanyl-D-alanine carboxypeptidase
MDIISLTFNYMAMKFILIILVIVLLYNSCAKIPACDCMGRENYPVNSFITSGKAKAIAEVTCKYINDEKVPAIQITIIDSIGTSWSLSTGTADKKRKNRVTDESIFRLASITKTFTASVIFKLIEEGKLTADDKLTSFFPEYTNAPDVTIKNLLDHSSGIKELLILPDVLMGSTLNTDKICDINQIVKTISRKKLDFATGSDHKYSNTNTVLLGLIAEKISGKKMKELYRDYLLKGLNIHNIIFSPYEGIPAGLVSGYDRKLLPTPGLYEVTAQNTAWATSAFTSGALVATSSDAALFFHNLFMGNIISDSSLSTMKSFEPANNPDNNHLKYFGKGMFKWDINGNTYWGHEGVFVGFDNIAGFREKDKTTIVILGNISTYNKFGLLGEIDAIISL